MKTARRGTARRFKSYLLRQMLTSLRLGVRTICRFVVIGFAVLRITCAFLEKTVEHGVGLLYKQRPTSKGHCGLP